MIGAPSGRIDQDFKLFKVMEVLHIPWNEILDTPESVIDCAFDNWMAERDADIELSARRR